MGEMNLLVARPQCPRCAYPLAGEGDPCPFCLGKKPFGRLAALATYQEPLRQLIHRYKYHGRWRLARPLTRLLLDKGHTQNILAEAEVIVPVPLFWRRRLARGFNQAELLARVVAAQHGLPLVRAVRRVRDTPMQTTLGSAVARARNMRGAFAARPTGELAGRRVVLVDDVLTTGATLRAVARALEVCEPASVDALVLAIADPRQRDFTTL